MAVKRMLRAIQGAVAACALMSVSALAQTDGSAISFYQEQGQLIRGSRGVTALGDQLFGDRVDLYTGALSFSQTDISLPGNSGLEVAVRRQYTAGRKFIVGHFGDWDLDLPRISGNYATSNGWVGRMNTGGRCSNFGAPGAAYASNGTDAWPDYLYWSGVHLTAPGGGGEVLSRHSSNTQAPTDGQSYPLVTRGGWQIRCLPTIANGSGEGFVALSPEGVQYRFNWLASRFMRPLSKTPSINLPRREFWMLPTEVRDRFGNTVTYTYDAADPWKVTKIQASDGRTLNFTYIASADGKPRIQTVSDGRRTWTYAYADGKRLSSVTQPDNSQWTFNLSGFEVFYPSMDSGASCLGGPGDYPETKVYTGTMTHPSGATGSFGTRFIQHGRRLPGDGKPTCINLIPPNKVSGVEGAKDFAVTPTNWYTQALETKTISGPGLADRTWTFAWGVAGAADVPGGSAMSITEPDGSVTLNVHGFRFGVNEGQLLAVKEGWNGTSALRTTTMRYREPSGMPYPEPVGTSDVMAVDTLSLRLRPMDRKVIQQQGKSFSWEATAFDVFARPTAATKSGPSGSRSESTTYFDQKTIWVLGQTQTQTIEGQTALSQEFDPNTAMVTSITRFGALDKRMTYQTDGMLASRTDGRNNTTSFSQYKLGLPRLVSYPNGATETAEVDDLGFITSVKSMAGYTTSYGYDAIGRLNSVTPPSGWTPVSLAFEAVNAAEYGIPAGHWRQTISQGNARTVTYFDALWQPLMTRSWDAANEAGTRSVIVKRFDTDGHVAYQSYPQRDVAAVTDSPAGTRSQYDALGRVTREERDSEQGVLSTTHEYLDGFQTKTTNARGFVTTQGFWALDQADTSKLASIAMPEGINVALDRDVFGKTTSITRSGNAGGYASSVTRHYVYDGNQRLCKTIEPEIGATVQTYDGAGNVAWRAPGLALPDAASCDTGSVPETRRIGYSYDSLNRLETVSYGDGSPGVSRTYTADGLPATIASDGTTWTFDYNSLRKNTSESLSIDGRSLQIKRDYDALGSLSTLTYPDNASVSYAPNALGRATTVSGAASSYASGINYHPDGAVSAYTLGNGIVHALTQNARGLPDLNQDGNVLKDRYTYDANGNITAITDELGGSSPFSRQMTYDGADRLITASAPQVWGSAAYEYDPVDNLRRSSIGGRTYTMGVDGNNRLNSVTGSENLSYEYDAGGNIVRRGAQQYAFDLGNRMRALVGKSTYRYDGEGRRVWVENADGSKQLQMYSHVDGKLLYAENTTGQVAASVTSYSCPAGQTLSGSNCISTTTSSASIASYSCPSGYTLSGTSCTAVASTTVAATLSSYSCPAGQTVSGSQCLNTVTQNATVSSYTCPSGFSLSGTTCTRTTTSTSAATPVYSCPGGQTLSGTSCVATSSYGATPVYSCPSGYSLSGTQCNGTTQQAAAATPDCKGKGTLQPAGWCLMRTLVVMPGDDSPTATCTTIASGMGLNFFSLMAGSRPNYYNCYIGPAYNYSCPNGGTLSGQVCVSPSTVAATLSSYSCPSGGSVSGSSCVVTSTSAASVSYSCPAGQAVSDSSCVATNTETQGASPVYACDTGYTLSGSTCSTVVSSAATPVYSCSQGFTLSGTQCTSSTTTTVAATPNYSCPSGQALSGSTCTATNTAAASPVYGCPNGGSLQGQQCVGGGGPTSQTKFVYLGTKLLAEQDTVAGIAYTHTDMLGSPVARSQGVAGGGSITNTRFEPYGAVAQGFTPNQPYVSGFTGHVQDGRSGLVYMQQRYYDPLAGRFLGVDQIATDSDTGRSFSRYGYASNSPFGFLDPDGREIECPDGEGGLPVCPQVIVTGRSQGSNAPAGGSQGRSTGNMPTPGKPSGSSSPCQAITTKQVREALPDKAITSQVADGFASYIDGLAWGGTAIAARAGLIGDFAKQQAIGTNERLMTVGSQIAAHPSETATVVGGVLSKYPVQAGARIGTGYGLALATTPLLGVPTTMIAGYGSAFKEAYRHPSIVAVEVVVGSVCN